MFFNSYIFILLFIPMILLGYFGLNHIKKYKLAVLYLTVMSLWFYGYFNLQFLLDFLVCVSINFCISRVLVSDKFRHRRLILGLGVAANIVYLLVCKYSNFFIESINEVFKSDYSLWNIAMPLGISFYTFQQIAYLVASYRKETKNENFLEYVSFMSFFPQIVEGPIVLHDEWIPKLKEIQRKSLNYENLLKGFYGFSLGLAKKVLIADYLDKIVSIGYFDIMDCTATDAWIVMISYALQLYFDFSGYCDMAYGLSVMLNLEVPVNFNSPYKAVSIADFWDRWHMSLTRFFTKYLYIPLGGNRKGVVRTYINVLMVFAISGLWHGASWNFVVWGLMNGIAMVLYRLLKKFFEHIPQIIMIVGTFVFDVFAWAMFRAKDVHDGFVMMSRVFHGEYVNLRLRFSETFSEIFEIKILQKMDVLHIFEKCPQMLIYGTVLILLIAVFGMKNTQQKMQEYKPGAWKLFVTVFLLTWSVISLSEVSTFIYVNF